MNWTAGDLNERVTLRHRTKVKDGVGGVTASLTTYDTVWAHVRPLTGRERQNAQRTEASVDHMVVVRNRTDIVGDDVIEWRGRKLNVRVVKYLGAQSAWLELEAELGAAV